MMNKGIIFVFISVLFLSLVSCTPEEGEKGGVRKKVENKNIVNEQFDVEVVAVSDFNNHPPFFSALKDSEMEWATIEGNCDSIKKFQFKSSTVYALKDEIVKSKIVDDGVVVNHGIHTGMSRARFNAHFTGLSANEDAVNGPIIRLSSDEVFITCCLEETQYWEFKFAGDTLYEIDYYQYYD